MTAAQEAILEQIIEAFQNGKRLSDLPDVSGTNPFNLICEVLEDGESKKAALATLLPYMEEECSYGIEFDTAVSSPACTRIGNLSLHKSLPIHNRMKGCLLNDDGEVVEYLNPANWTGQTRDGSRGQVMVELPMHYRKFETDGTKRRVRISEYPLPGYRLVPGNRYVSAYQATIQRSTTTLCSVVNMDADYRGGNNNTAYDGTYRTFLGRPATGISRTNFRNYARKRKSGSTEWNCMTYDIQKNCIGSSPSNMPRSTRRRHSMRKGQQRLCAGRPRSRCNKHVRLERIQRLLSVRAVRPYRRTRKRHGRGSIPRHQ